MCRHLCFLLVLLVPVRIYAAIACSVSPPSVEKLYARTSAVFVGHVVSVEEAGVVSTGEPLPPRVAVEGTFRVIEVLKGQPPPDGKIRAPSFEACGAALHAGWEYLFFLHEGNFIRTWDGALPVYKWPNERKHYLEKLGIDKKG
jgi:hypothetical protein